MEQDLLVARRVVDAVLADELLGAEVLHRVAGLEGEHAADEAAKDGDDRQGGVADQVALLDEAPELPRQRADVRQRAPQQLQRAAQAF